MWSERTVFSGKIDAEGNREAVSFFYWDSPHVAFSLCNEDGAWFLRCRAMGKTPILLAVQTAEDAKAMAVKAVGNHLRAAVKQLRAHVEVSANG